MHPKLAQLLRPRSALWLLLGAIAFAFAFLVAIEKSTWVQQRLGFEKAPFALETAQWLVILTIFVVGIGWIVTAIVAVHNSIKQHTVNTLLQSRLSVAFQEKQKEFAKVYPRVPVPI